MEPLSNQALSLSFLIETKISSQKLKSKAPKGFQGLAFPSLTQEGYIGGLFLRRSLKSEGAITIFRRLGSHCVARVSRVVASGVGGAQEILATTR